MRTIIAGSRTITNYNMLLSAIDNSKFNITTVISGGCRGPDELGEKWASNNDVLLEIYKPDWSLGKKAGPLRNSEMIQKGRAEALILLWNGKSRGSFDMLTKAFDNKLNIWVQMCHENWN